MERNVIGWIEIPAQDLDRAKAFYELVFDFEMEKTEYEGMGMIMFPFDDALPGSAACLIHNENYTASATDGPLVYFTAHSGDLNNELSRVEGAGGKVLGEKYAIGEHGFVGMFIDTEGNRIAMHSMK